MQDMLDELAKSIRDAAKGETDPELLKTLAAAAHDVVSAQSTLFYMKQEESK